MEANERPFRLLTAVRVAIVKAAVSISYFPALNTMASAIADQLH